MAILISGILSLVLGGLLSSIGFFKIKDRASLYRGHTAGILVWAGALLGYGMVLLLVYWGFVSR